MKVSAFQSRSFLLLLFGASIASGIAACWHRAAPTSRPTPRPARRTEPSVQVSIAAAVQSLPAYQDARSACSRGQYQRAAEILARVAQSRTLNEDQRAFARAQQQICLNHLIAGNPPHPQAGVPLFQRGRNAQHLLGGGAAGTRPYGGSNAPSASDCGPRALALACEQLGIHATVPELAKAAGLGPRGTSFQGLKNAAEALHLKCDALQVSRDALPDLPTPAIAWVHENHFVTVLALQGRGESGVAIIRDSNEARAKTISQEQLLQSSGGYLLTLHR
jgi:hypothetical protein